MKLFAMLALALMANPLSLAKSQMRIICYWQGILNANLIDPNVCTHIIYAFIGVDEAGKLYYANSDVPQQIKSIVDMKQKNPNLILMAAIGGASEEFSEAFSKLSSTFEVRKQFVDNVVSLVQQHSLQGIDIDWEFPTSDDDKQNFVLLLEELKSSFKAFGFVLSAAVAPDKWRAQEFYDIPKVSDAVDFLNVMAYDFYGPWSENIGHHAQMYPHIHDSSYMKELNCAASISFWINGGALRNKLVLGIPTYGKAFVLLDPSENRIGSKVNSNETKSSRGNIGYNEFCSEKNSGWKQHFDTSYRAYYATSKLLWLGFDTIRQVKTKARYVQDFKLGGVMFWSLDTDDYNGVCRSGKFPLITASHLLIN